MNRTHTSIHFRQFKLLTTNWAFRGVKLAKICGLRRTDNPPEARFYTKIGVFYLIVIFFGLCDLNISKFSLFNAKTGFFLLIAFLLDSRHSVCPAKNKDFRLFKCNLFGFSIKMSSRLYLSIKFNEDSAPFDVKKHVSIYNENVAHADNSCSRQKQSIIALIFLLFYFQPNDPRFYSQQNRQF